jgi:hypothetical protein
MPAFIESIVYLDRDCLEESLINNIGYKQLKSLKKCAQKANSFSKFEFFSFSDVLKNSEILNVSASLHNFNAIKYNHPINYYDKYSLQEITHSCLKENFYIGIRLDKHDNSFQVCFFLLDHSRSHLYVLAQGINQKYQPTGVNLYAALFFEFFLFAESKGLKEVHLGRGAAFQKRHLGANVFYKLNHWIKPLKIEHQQHIKLLSNKSNCHIENIYSQLSENLS